MKTYFAIQGQTVYRHGLQGCLDWARKQSEINAKPVQILTARGGEVSGKIIAEVTPEIVRFISEGRTISVRNLRNGR